MQRHDDSWTASSRHGKISPSASCCYQSASCSTTRPLLICNRIICTLDCYSLCRSYARTDLRIATKRCTSFYSDTARSDSLQCPANCTYSPRQSIPRDRKPWRNPAAVAAALNAAPCYFHEIYKVGVTELALGSSIDVYPNPTNDRLTLKTKNLNKNLSYELYDSQGKQIHKCAGCWQ